MSLRNKIANALNSKAQEFTNFDQQLNSSSLFYDEKICEFSKLNYEEILANLSDFSAPGAIPSAEFQTSKNLVVKFDEQWSNHEEARNWAYKILLGHPTFAADGSQIMPSKDLSLPVAAIQVAWFENPHTPNGQYTKNTRVEVLSPNDLLMGKGAELQVSDQMVNLRRFQLEVEVLTEYMENYAQNNDTSKTPPLVFLDSSIVISFAERWHEDQRKLFIEPLIRLLDVSEATNIPIVGYVDTTLACDITVMFKYFFALDIQRSPIHDAYLFRNLAWGDRSIFFTCARAGLLDQFGKHKRGVGFVYLKTNQNLPARLDIPVWVYEKGLLDYVINLVRAEVVVGVGYPYPLATADATAFISSTDREAFYQIFQQFLQKQEINLHISQKALSKSQTRR
ncbi:MAG: DNA double-strand break repair nuclease NurA [Blastocatellia bacterium]